MSGGGGNGNARRNHGGPSGVHCSNACADLKFAEPFSMKTWVKKAIVTDNLTSVTNRMRIKICPSSLLICALSPNLK